MHTESLKVSTRTDTGKGAARKLRARGLAPAVVYGHGASGDPIAVDIATLEAIFRRTNDRNTLLGLEEGGKIRTCLVKETHRHPVSRELLHADFYQVDPDAEVKVRVDIRCVGTPEGVRMGGRLQIMRRDMMVSCKPADIPDFIEVDVAKLGVGKYKRASEIVPPAGVNLLFTGDFNIVSVIGKKAPTAAKAEA